MVPRNPEDRILLVDDLALVRRTVPARLGSLGAKVSGVANVAEAVEWLAKHEPILILLDVVLPGKDGFTFCRELKQDPRFRDIPVIILTDVVGNVFERSLEAGADDYLPKRISDAFMRIRVNLHLHLAELRQHPFPGQPGEAKAKVLLASRSALLQSQLRSQLAADGHELDVAESLDGVLPRLTGEENLLILDRALDPDGIHDLLTELRMDPDASSLPVLLLCDKEDVEQLAALEFMLDDVLVKPLTAPLTRQRLKLLLEMGSRILHP